MRRLHKREQVLIVLCSVVVGAAVWLQLHPPPTPAGQSALLPPARAEQAYRAALRQIAQLSDDQAALEPRIARQAYDLPPDSLVPRLIRDLNRLADRAGVHLREIKPLRPHDLATASGTQVPLEVRFTAPFQPNVMKFLYFVEDPAGKMTVDKLALTSTDQKLKTVDVSAEIAAFTTWTAGAAAGAEGGQKSAANTVD
ncbi:MAG TPA: type 4a pilus biogenesis protein PilO [Chthonomonadaceae bacterium]|nr:type 4a pilus biogenesis protein PilO [Chthonomonadaceae bacterium]